MVCEIITFYRILLSACSKKYKYLIRISIKYNSEVLEFAFIFLGFSSNIFKTIDMIYYIY